MGRFFIRWVDRVTQGAAARADWNTAAERDSALALLGRARLEFVRRGGE